MLYADFDRHLEKLATPEWKDGVSGLLLLLNHPLLLQKPLEFIELKKSIFYNLALIYKDKNDCKNALYFYFNFYKLNPDNVSVVVEIAILCRRELMVDQSLYFFELAFDKDSSAAMKLVYLEQIAILKFVAGHLGEALEKINILISADFKKNVLAELGQIIVDELNQTEKDKYDFFSSSYQYCPPIKTSSEDKRLPYVSKVLELRDEYALRKLQAAKIFYPASSSQAERKSMQQEFITVTIPKPRWKELLNALLMVLKIHKLKTSGATMEEIKSKLDKSSSYKYLNDLDFDIFTTKFQFNLIVPAAPVPVMSLLPKVSPLRVEELIKEKPREERYGGGQMALREKKVVAKQVDPAPPTPEANFNKGLDSCIQAILKENFEPKEVKFLQSELNSLIGGYTVSLSAEAFCSEVDLDDLVLLGEFCERDEQALRRTEHLRRVQRRKDTLQ